jgi:cytochrome P450
MIGFVGFPRCSRLHVISPEGSFSNLAHRVRHFVVVNMETIISPSQYTYSILGGLTSPLAVRIYVVIFLITSVHIAYNTFLHPISNVPGPLLARYSSIWLTKRYFRGTWLEDVVQLHDRYGPVVRIAPNEVSFVDDSALHELYGHGKPNQKSQWYDTWVIPGMGDSFFATTNRKIHHRIRSRVSGTYSMTAILAMEELVSDVITLNLEKLTAVAKSSKPIRLDQYVNYFTFDVVGQLSMGGPIGFLEQEKDVDGNIASIHDGFYLMANMGHVPWKMFWFNNPISRLVRRILSGERANSFQKFLGWLETRVDQRMRDGLGDKRPDMLHYFINGKTSGGTPVSKAEVMIEGVNILGAGADTTTVAILAVFGQLLTRKGSLSKAQQEVDKAHANLEPSGFLPFRELEKLPYLTAVIRESMRLHPSITYQLPRVPPADGIQIAQYHIPSTVTCGISPAAMNRSRKLFGNDADKFVPERWIPSDDTPEEQKRLRKMEQNLTTVSSYIAEQFMDVTDLSRQFGMGSRSCVGRNLAIVEVYKYTASFLRTFEAEIVNEQQPWKTQSQWFSLQRDFWVKLHLRTDKD